jgi:membrane protein required for colicin V production
VNFNWLDVVLGLILALSVLRGFLKGLARTGIGVAAVVLGLIFGLWFYGTVGSYFRSFVDSRPVANLIGFLTVFALVLALGGLLGVAFDKLLKIIHLSWLNRLLGAGFGLVRGVLVSTVIVFVLMAFSAKPPPHSVAQSRIAPYVVGAARVMAYAAPHDVRESFRGSYDKVKQAWAEIFEKKKKRPATDSI